MYLDSSLHDMSYPTEGSSAPWGARNLTEEIFVTHAAITFMNDLTRHASDAARRGGSREKLWINLQPVQ